MAMMKNTERFLKAPAILMSLIVTALVIGGVTPNLYADHQIGHAGCCGRQDVILIRGGAGYWPGARAMSDHFSELGYKPSLIYGWEFARVADEIAVATSEGRMAGGIVIVGYSSGADIACALASRLGKEGIRVQTMVLIESTFGLSVPANVDYCVNYYASRILYNVDVKTCSQYAEMANRSHFTICNSPLLRQVTGQIVESRHPAVVMSPQQVVTNIPLELSAPSEQR
jgi:pimeloyl-ACP methyl ester carboxylesterase